MQVDASVQKQVADVRQFQVTLTPTSRATNQVQLSGRVDMSDTNGIQGNLKLVADSLDFTSYYDLFMGAKPTAGMGAATAPAPTRAPVSAPAAASSSADKEPEAIKLPLRNFTAEATIRRLYLHEMEIADWQTTVKIDGGHVVMNPFKLALNGAPVSTTLDMDLGVPGWKYDWSLSAQAIPLAPLVNSFQPDRKGILSGTLTAQAKLAGAGITGASLQKNLTGQFDMVSTNLNLSVDNIQGKTAIHSPAQDAGRHHRGHPRPGKEPREHGRVVALGLDRTGQQQHQQQRRIDYRLEKVPDQFYRPARHCSLRPRELAASARAKPGL
jgi:uncharacterized protein involved in outer membrane biogenesis